MSTNFRYAHIPNLHKLSLYLRPVSIMQLSLIESLEYRAYKYQAGTFQVAIEADELISHDFIRQYAQSISQEIFIHEEDYDILAETLAEELLKLTRALSIGDALKNTIKQSNLLSFQMSHLYRKPFKNSLLTHQFQCAKNLGLLLLDNTKIHQRLYKNINKQHHHYISSQPLLSSIFLLSFIKELKLFSDQEAQNLFLASYFKDIGMSFVTLDKLNAVNLDDFDKNILKDHASNSVKLLENRIPLAKRYLSIIENHNYLNNKAFDILSPESSETRISSELMGVETTLVNAIDVLVAMTNKRPYRSEYTLFKSLEFLKILISDDYPQEYKALVKFATKFLKD